MAEPKTPGVLHRRALARSPALLLAFVAGLITLILANSASAANPFIQQGSKLTGGEEVGGGEFGRALALSADGNTALIGGRGDNNQSGAAWVFIRSGSTWTQQGPKLTGSGESEGLRFGYSVALSADGNTALIGGYEEKLAGRHVDGAAWVFTRSGSTWTQQGPVLRGEGSAGELEGFSISVALSADGNTALIGARGLLQPSPHPGQPPGGAFIFTRSGSTWTRQAKLTGLDEEEVGGSAPSDFGSSVSLSADGNTALIGAGNARELAGAAWVFSRSGSSWTQQGPMLTGGPPRFGNNNLGSEVHQSADGYPNFGSEVYLSADGDTAAMGGEFTWVFTRSHSTWTQEDKLPQGGPTTLSSDGNTILVGNSDGEVWVFTRSGSSWIEQSEVLTPKSGEEAGQSSFGSTVALSADGKIALIGGAFDNTDEGAAWVFTNPTPPSPTARVSLASTTAGVNRRGQAAIALTCTGTAPACDGSLALTATATMARLRRSASVKIGSVSGSIPSGQTTTVELHLTAIGRMLLRAHHGQLAATLTILKSTPAPSEEQTDSVSLVQE